MKRLRSKCMELQHSRPWNYPHLDISDLFKTLLYHLHFIRNRNSYRDGHFCREIVCLGMLKWFWFQSRSDYKEFVFLKDNVHV